MANPDIHIANLLSIHRGPHQPLEILSIINLSLQLNLDNHTRFDFHGVACWISLFHILSLNVSRCFSFPEILFHCPKVFSLFIEIFISQLLPHTFAEHLYVRTRIRLTNIHFSIFILNLLNIFLNFNSFHYIFGSVFIKFPFIANG